MRILFISKKAYRFYYAKNISCKTIVDYFDIEVQKIIQILGYRYKKSPKIENIAIVDQIPCFDLDIFSWVDPQKAIQNVLEVSFECVQ